MTDLHISTLGSGEPIVFIHGSGPSWSEETFEKQRELAEDYKLLFVDRRGYGDSPPADYVDFEKDATDVAEVLGDGAHLVGHSYGGVVSLLAASKRPASVKTLTVIEPPALGLARKNAAVERFISRLTQAYSNGQHASPEEFWHAFIVAFGFEKPPRVAYNEKDLKGLRATMVERPPWEAKIPLELLASAPFPKLVVSGGWRNVPQQAREIAGAALGAVCDVLEKGLRAERAVFEEAAHNPQMLGKPFNDRLQKFLETTHKH